MLLLRSVPQWLLIRGAHQHKTKLAATKKVLEALPGIDSSLAKATINHGDSKKAPFNEIGETMEI